MTRPPTSRLPDPVAEIEAAIARDEGTPDDEDPLDDPDVDEDILDADLDPVEDADAAEAEVIGEAAAVADETETDRAAGRHEAGRRQDRRASPPRTTSPRPGGRSCASTSPGCWPASRGPGWASTSRSCTGCASRPDASGRRGGCSAIRSGASGPAATATGSARSPRGSGAVRDLDVLLEAADHYRKDLPVTEQRALEPLLADWRAHRDDALVLLTRELDSEDYQRWVEDYREFVRTDGAAVLPVGPVEAHRVRDTAPSAIWAAYQQVRAYEPVLRWADIETLHELRIAAKWLRYSLEFVREALGPESAPLIARVTALQDHLGLMHDADVAASMARAFLVAHAGDLSTQESAAIGRYLVSCEREVTRLRRSIAVPWRGVAGIGFRRGLGRVVAGL